MRYIHLKQESLSNIKEVSIFPFFYFLIGKKKILLKMEWREKYTRFTVVNKE